MNEPKRRGRRPNPEQPSEFARRESQAYALRVWNGQSHDLHRKERLERVAAALEAQGMSMDGVVL